MAGEARCRGAPRPGRAFRAITFSHGFARAPAHRPLGPPRRWLRPLRAAGRAVERRGRAARRARPHARGRARRRRRSARPRLPATCRSARRSRSSAVAEVSRSSPSPRSASARPISSSPADPATPAALARAGGRALRPLALATEPTPVPAASAPIRPPPLPAAPAPPTLSTLAALDALAVADAGAVPDFPLARPPAAPAAPTRRARPRAGSSLPALAVTRSRSRRSSRSRSRCSSSLARRPAGGGRVSAGCDRRGAPSWRGRAVRHLGGAKRPLRARARRPLLFVRGDVVSRAQASVRSVHVAVEVVREGTVSRAARRSPARCRRRRSSGARSADALAKVARRAAARAPERIARGKRFRSSSRIDEYPQELGGTALRISVVPEEARGR